MKLYKEQELSKEKILEHLNRYKYKAVFFQAPPGWGKTALAVSIGNYFYEQGRNVIIATLRNELVANFYRTVKELGGHDNAEIIVGRNNYIIIDRALEFLGSDIKKMPFCKVEEVEAIATILEQEKANGNSFIVASDFEKLHAALADTETWTLVKYFAFANENDEVPTLAGDTPRYCLTNIFYLSMFLFNEKLREKLMPNTVILLDEVDYFAEAMRNHFSTRFSLHSIKVFSKYLFFQTGLKIFEKLAKSAEKARDDIALLGLYKDDKEEDNENIVKKSYEILKKRFTLKLIKEALMNIDKKRMRNFYEQIYELNRFMNEMKSDNPVYSRYGVSFSSIRHYPSINRVTKTRADARKEIYNLWRYMTEDGNVVVGFGATVSANYDPRDDAGQYYDEVAQSLTLPPKDFKYAFLPVEEFIERDKYNIKVFLSPDGTHHYTYANNKVNELWMQYIAKVVSETYKRDSKAVVIVKSRESANELAKYIEKTDKTIKVIYDYYSDISKVLSAFRTPGPSLLVIHSGLGVGMNIPEIEQLYIAQLPFPLPKHTSGAPVRDFIQWTGRLRNNPEKERELYVLDSRISKGAPYTKSMVKYLQRCYASVQTLKKIK